MTTNENNVTAQAGDEPMREAFVKWAVSEGWHRADAEETASGKDLDMPRLAAAWKGYRAAHVSPRATADVERVTITPALRRAVDMTRADLGESGSNYPAVRELLAFAESHIATTKPGA